MRTCPDCDQEIDEEIEACPECGAALTPAEGVTKWTCPKCKQEVTSDYEVCWACGTTIEGVEDPGFLDESGLQPDVQNKPPIPENLTTVARYLMAPEAHTIRDKLEAEGIPAFILDEFTNTVALLSNTASGGAKVLVPEDQLERAREIVGVMAVEEAEQERQDEELDDEEADESAETDEDEDEDDGAEGMDDADDEQPPEENITEKAP